MGYAKNPGSRKHLEVPIEDRLIRKTKKMPNGCIEWQGSTFGSMGYGHIWFRNKTPPVHRVSYEIFIGPIPDGLLVLHRCDNPLCVNPAHLFLGTTQDNSADRIAKDRRGKAARLTKDQVVEARQRYAADESQASLSRAYGVSDATIYAIVHRQTWKDF